MWKSWSIIIQEQPWDEEMCDVKELALTVMNKDEQSQIKIHIG